MKTRRIFRILVAATTAVFALQMAHGAFAQKIEEEFMACLDNATSGDIEAIDVAKRISCCKQAGGAWVEIYDPDGNVVDGFCDGAEEVYEPDEESVAGGFQVNPAALDNLVSGVLVAQPSDPAAEVDDASSSGSIASASSDPSPAPDAQPAPKKVKRHRHHRRHR